ncbi:F-box domain-containing protein [Mycena indigotica]|uniref:F-box domain-containing protein n=1 Tax=Mycena indigotica TaxID=2126181 RepID=A0A8H6SQP9_9AGAR|nr:F-box domain-containing protein [Mycena indigotica]KAF7304078.1 F-box domain-containing protein [Mycena indigotica]
MHLDDLPVDIVREIFAWCDVYTVLRRLMLVSRDVRRLAKEKSLWVVLVRDLALRGLVDVAPHKPPLSALSTRQLVAMVRHAVIGPHSWLPAPILRPGRSESGATPSTTRAVTLSVPAIVPTGNGYTPVELVPGGRFLVFRTHMLDVMQLVDLASGKCVWQSAERAGDLPFSVDVSAEGGVAIMVAANRAGLDGAYTEIKAWQYSQTTRLVEETLVATLPVAVQTQHTLMLTPTQYCVFRTGSRDYYELAVVDIRRARFAMLRRPANDLADYCIFGEYIAIASGTSKFLSLEESLTLEIYPFRAFVWRSVHDWATPLSELLGSVYILPAYSHTIATPWLANLFVSGLPDPLHAGRYRLRVDTHARHANPTAEMLAAYHAARGPHARALAEKIALPWSFTYVFGPGGGNGPIRLDAPTAAWRASVLDTDTSFAGYALARGQLVDTVVHPGAGLSWMRGPRVVPVHARSAGDGSEYGTPCALARYSPTVVSLVPKAPEDAEGTPVVLTLLYFE